MSLDNLLVITGGKNPSHQRDTMFFQEVLSDLCHIQNVDLGVFSKASLEGVNSLVVFTSLEGASDSQLDDVVDFYKSEEKNLVFLHEASVYNRYHEGLREIIGLRFLEHKKYGYIDVYLGHPHFMTYGLPNRFGTEDELYFFDSRSALSLFDKIFMYTASGHPIGIERHHNRSNSRLVYISLGHDSATLNNPTFRALIKNLGFLFKAQKRDIKKQFGYRSTVIAPLGNNTVESVPEGSRWNQLSTRADSVHSHSGFFVPLDPVAYLNRMKMFRVEDIDKMGDEALRYTLINMLSLFEIRNTDHCNQRCYYCYSHRGRTPGFELAHITYDTHKRLEDALIAMKDDKGTPLAIRYCGGGDPLCHPRTVPSIKKFEVAGIYTFLITNGMALDKEQIDILANYSTMVRFSVDATSAESYARIHGTNEETFKKVMANFEGIARKRDSNGRRGKMYLRSTFLINRYNFQEVLYFCKMMKDIGADSVRIRPLPGEPEFTVPEIDDINTQIGQARALSDNSFHVDATNYKVARPAFDFYESDETNCWSVFTKTFLQPNGDLALCISNKNVSIGNIYNSDIRKIWGGKKHIEIIRGREWEKCLSCSESEFNKSVEFLYQHQSEEIFKTRRN